MTENPYQSPTAYMPPSTLSPWQPTLRLCLSLAYCAVSLAALAGVVSLYLHTLRPDLTGLRLLLGSVAITVGLLPLCILLGVTASRLFLWAAGKHETL